MSIDCEILDDRPSTTRKLEGFLKEKGISTRVSTRPGTWAINSGVLGDPGVTPVPVVIDNHQDKLGDLGLFGREDVKTSAGSDAGMKILYEILLPLIDSGKLRDLPIAVVSAHGIDDERKEFRGQYPRKYDNVFFFSKEKEGGQGAKEAVSYANSVKTYLEKLSTKSRDSIAFFTVLDDVADTFEFTEADLQSVFRISSESPVKDLKQELASMRSDYWHEKVMLLLRIRDSLGRVFAQRADPTESIREWLLSTEFETPKGTARDLLLSGRFDDAQLVADRASFWPEYR